MAAVGSARAILARSIPVVQPLFLPGAPAAVYSVIRKSDYQGPCLQVRRANGDTQDIGFLNNVVDKAAADAFGPNLTISKWYDQSGNGRDLTQGTAANQPAFTSYAEVNAIRPVSFNPSPSGTGKGLTIPAFTLARTDYSVLMLANPTVSRDANVYWEFTSGATTYAAMFTEISVSGISINNNGSVTGSTIAPRAQLTTISYRSGASQLFTINGASSSKTAASSQSMAAGGQVGKSIAGANFNGKWDCFCLVVYASALSDDDNTAVLNSFTASGKPQTSFSTQLVYGGSSLVSGVGTSFNNNAVRQELLPPAFQIINLGDSFGQTLAGQYAERTAQFAFYDGTKAKNVFVIEAPSNDIAGQTFADEAAALTFANNLYNNTTLPFVTAALGSGFNGVMVPTVIARGSFTTVNFKENARLQYNSNVVGGVANGYKLSDRAAAPQLSDATNTTYFNSDQIHPTMLGYSYMAPRDHAAINSV